MKSLKDFIIWLGLGTLSVGALSVEASVVDTLVRKVQHRSVFFTVASIPLDQYKIDLIAEPNAQKVAKNHNPLLMMNAGMFHPIQSWGCSH